MLRQKLSLKLQQKLSPQQIQLMKLLQIPTVALEQRIKEEMEANPALEEGREELHDQEDPYDGEQDSNDEFDLSDYLQEDDIPSYRLNAKNTGKDQEDKTMPISMSKTFHELLRDRKPETGPASFRCDEGRENLLAQSVWNPASVVLQAHPNLAASQVFAHRHLELGRLDVRLGHRIDAVAHEIDDDAP